MGARGVIPLVGAQSHAAAVAQPSRVKRVFMIFLLGLYWVLVFFWVLVGFGGFIGSLSVLIEPDVGFLWVFHLVSISVLVVGFPFGVGRSLGAKPQGLGYRA